MSWFKSLWHKYLLGAKQPWAREERDEKGKLQVTDYNHAYVQDVIAKLADPALTTSHTNDELVKLWVDRINYEREEPRLEVLHMGIERDGQIKMKLDWNNAFIKQCHEQGISGENEEETVQLYLELMTRRVADGEAQEARDARRVEESQAKRLPDKEALERELESMDPDLVKSLEKVIRSRAARKGPRKVTRDAGT